jgi:bifunctional non-homologous end joining protein LigD
VAVEGDTAVADDEDARGSWPAPSTDELAALDALGSDGTWPIDGRDLRLTNLDKVLFPAASGRAAVTKRDLVRHMALCAPVIMPYLAGRPVNMHRFPDGADSPGFWHKAVPSHAPQWLGRWRNEDAESGKTDWYIVADGAASLAWMANFGALELHPWTSTCAHPDLPTWALIDIDPGTTTSFDETLVLARLYRTALAHLGVEGRPKVTGQRGVQIWVPVRDGTTFDDTRVWVEQLSRAIGKVVPDLVSWSWRTAQRHGRARLDYTQNARSKTLVAPFSPRAAAGAPVSVTLEWDELDDPDLRPDRWCISDVVERLARWADPLAPLVGRQQELPGL